MQDKNFCYQNFRCSILGWTSSHGPRLVSFGVKIVHRKGKIQLLKNALSLFWFITRSLTNLKGYGCKKVEKLLEILARALFKVELQVAICNFSQKGHPLENFPIFLEE